MKVTQITGLLALLLTGAVTITAQETRPATFEAAFDAIKARPEYRHALFGVEVYSIDRKKVLFEWNGDKLFTPGSTTKLLTEGTALQLFGPGFRFHTPVYRTGKIDRKGVLRGDLVLVASGDPNLSDRMQKDGTLAFENEDHSYGGFDSKLVAGDPLMALKELATQIAAAGIRKVEGHVRIDTSLFPEGDRELGTGVTISPISVNDNVIDAVLSAGSSVGSPALISFSPQVPFIRFINQVRTGSSASTTDLDEKTAASADGGLEVTITGTIPLGGRNFIAAYPVPSPSRFASALLIEALESQGIGVAKKEYSAAPSSDALKSFYTPQNKVAERVSAPLSEELKITLKVSQNLHASMTPFLLGAILGHAKENIDKKGFQLEHDFLTRAGLDLSGASQSDGAGGSAAAFYTPDFMVHYLAYMASQPNFAVFEHALPVLGRDGTLFNIQVDSPAAGHVFAKTGTFASEDLLNSNAMLVGKGLAGYTTTPSGERVAFAFFVNHVSMTDDPEDSTKYAGQALGEVSAAANLLPIQSPEAPATGVSKK